MHTNFIMAINVNGAHILSTVAYTYTTPKQGCPLQTISLVQHYTLILFSRGIATIICHAPQGMHVVTLEHQISHGLSYRF